MSKGAKPKEKKTPKVPQTISLPQGETLEDMSKNRWVLGPTIGKGGFGEIYSAQKVAAPPTNYSYVVKFEPHNNGPLFVEMHFYMKVCKKEDIEEFKKMHKLKSIGVPEFYGSGSHIFNNEKYRFVVIEKYGHEIQKLLEQNNSKFPTETVFKLSIQMLDVLEYFHSQGYVHADLKGTNILLGANKENKSQAYLLDFGLATKYSVDKKFKPNPKKAHDGTIEYTSRDAHKGVPTRRGDLEILSYNMIHWLGGSLPWENCLKDSNKVHQLKEENMDNLDKFLKKCFNNDSPPEALVQFLKYLNTLKFNEEPNYKKICDIFISGIKAAGGKNDNILNFTVIKRSPSKRRSYSANDAASVSPARKRNAKNVSASRNNTENVEVLTDAMREVLAKKLQKENHKKKPKTVVNKNGTNHLEIETDEIPSTSSEGNTRSRRNLAKVNYKESPMDFKKRRNKK